MTPVQTLPLVALCILAQGFFSGSEIAMVSASRASLASQAEQGHAGARRALDLLSEEERLLGTCLIGTNLSLVTGSTLVVAMLVQGGLEEVWATLAYTPLVLIFGETLPKTIFQYHATRLATLVSGPLYVIKSLFGPFLLIVSAWTSLISLISGASGKAFITREDLISLIEDEEAAIDPEDRLLIQRVLSMTETTVDECMTPLVQIVAIDEDDTVGDAVEAAIESGHSRLPVYRDRVDNIVGMVHHLDLLATEDDATRIAEITRPVPFVPDSKRADALLEELRAASQHLAVIVDEYGGSIGIVTVEDLIEEVVGEIRDERDEGEPAIRRLGERRWSVPAQLDIVEVAQAVDHPLPEDDAYESVAGLILAHTGRIPEVGEVVTVEGVEFRIQEANERAILTVQLTVPTSEQAP